MKLIKPSVEFWGEVPTDYEGTLKWIERAGRVCYKSEDKICEGSAEKFVKKLAKAGHWAMLEHSNWVLEISDDIGSDEADDVLCFLSENKFLSAVFLGSTGAFIGGNIRAWQEAVVNSPWAKPMLYSFIGTHKPIFNTAVPYVHNLYCSEAKPNEIPKSLKRYTVKFTCDRGVSHEIVRHRLCSFAQESTRYVDYGGKDIEFIEPSGWEDWEDRPRVCFADACEAAEDWYHILRLHKKSPQQARAVLPNALKTELVVTADAAEWAWIKKLRTAPDSHPDMRHIMNMVPWEEIL